jgi:ADP-ribosylglycohydrolase
MEANTDGRRDRLAGGLQGLLIGDALGVPYEFHSAAELPATTLIDFEPPEGFRRSHAGVPPGTWSDDGAQALCLLSSLLECGELNLTHFAGRLLNWAVWGYLAVDGHVFDIGVQTWRAMEALKAGVPPERAGPAGEYDNGNGALMRVLPVALWHQGDDAALVAIAAAQGLPTHGHPRSAVACAMLCLWARVELAGEATSWEAAASRLRTVGPAAGLPAAEIEHVLDPVHRQRVEGTGYVVDTLWSAHHVLDGARDYAQVVRDAIALGNDTDTTAAVAGGIAGIRFGNRGIPTTWRERLRGRDLFADLEHRLLQRAGLP